MAKNRKGALRVAVSADDGERPHGYGKPPKHSQFKPGVSGNPHGRRKRPKQAKTASQFILDYMKGDVPAREGDKLKRVPRMDALLHRLFGAAMSGHPSSASQLLKLVLNEDEVDEAAPPATELSPEDLETLRRYLKRRDDEGEAN